MSWQSYVDDQLIATGTVKRAAIVGLDGSTWATSAGFTISSAEVMKLVGGFSNPSDLLASGTTVAGVKYMTLRADSRSIYGKKGNTGIVCVKTGQTVLIGSYDEGQQPGPATVTVEKLADYLLEVGY